MTKLTRKNVSFVWDDKCQKSLDLAKKQLELPPILIYPDRLKLFHLFMDASAHTWSAVLMQTDDPELQSGTSPETREGEDSQTTQANTQTDKD